MAGRLGWVLYFVSALAGGWAVLFLTLFRLGGAQDTAMTVGIPALVLYGLGRAFRYVLSGE
jgi:hypothetical protein